MRKIFKIAKLELSVLFYSPVAWLMLAIFTVQSGIGFLKSLLVYQESIAFGRQEDQITNYIFSGSNGLFVVVQQNLYLYIPLLTMGLMSRETGSGSIKLLLSSPVKIRQIILGKYLAIITYGFLLICILALYGVTGAISIKDMDITMVLSGLLGLYLLICTYSAIGLFMSSLTSYQVVAAISTLALLAALRFIGSMWQGVAIVKDITYFLSISGRASDMIGGLTGTSDVFYFVILIFLFLALCILRLRSGRETRDWKMQAGRYAFLGCSVLLLGYLTLQPALIGYIDMTANQTRTLTRSSVAVVKQLNAPLKITTYANLFDEMVYDVLPDGQNRDKKTFEQYQRYIPSLKMDYVYYYDTIDVQHQLNRNEYKGLSLRQVAGKTAHNMGVDPDLFMPPAEIRRLIDLGPENNNVVRVLEYKGKKSILRFYDGGNPEPGEAEITAAIKRLTIPAKIAFVTGNNERSIDKKGDRNYQVISGMKKNRIAMINQGFEIDSVDPGTQDIPDDLSVLVLGDPAVPLDVQAQQRIAAYIDKGGNMLVTGEPGRQALLNPLLEPLGVRLKNGLLVTPSRDFPPDLVFGRFPDREHAVDSVFRDMQEGNARVTFQGSSALEYADPGTDTDSGKFHITPLMLSPATGWNRLKPVDPASTDVVFDAAGGDEKGVFPIELCLTRKRNHKEQRILVSGDADFMSNAELTRVRGNNLPFVMRIFKWFSYGAFPIDTSRPDSRDNKILVSRAQISAMKVFFLGIFPALLLAGGAFVLLRRRRM
jgi:ABC-2 type transport system permease protein